MIIAVLSAGATALCAEADAGRAKRVLMLFSENRFLPGSALAEQAATQALLQNYHGRIEIYAEYLDAIRFPDESHYQLFRDYLREKYAQRSPDLVMAFLARKFELAGELPAQLFPQAPVVLAALTEEEIPRERLGVNVTGVIQRVDLQGTLELMLRLQPDTQRIVVIGGTAALDQVHLGRAEAAARSFAGRVEFDFWTHRSVPEMQKEVVALPPRTVILFTSVFRDAAGVSFFPEQVVSLLAPVASVPVYVIVDSLLGKGAVGGAVAGLEATGKRAGELAQRVLSGAEPASLPFETRTAGIPMFDWRTLKRWGISESKLPSGSLVRFRPQSIWEQYRWYIIGALIIFTLQATMIAGLLLQRARRRRAEAELQRHRDELAHVARISTVGELTATVAHELNQPLGAILSNADAAEMFLKMEPPALDEVREILADIRKDDQRASEVIRRLRGLLRKQEMAPQAVEINAAVDEVLKLLSINASARKVIIKFEPTAGLPRVCYDPVHLQQVLLNLAVNGLEAMAEIPEDQRQLVVYAGHDGDGMVKVSVSDRGPGIPADKLSKLFEPFFTTKKEGMGMGLSIARTIVEAHHGQIWAENNSSAGATFYFTVPVERGKG